MENVKNLISNANNIAVIPSKVAGVDAFCAGVGLYHMLTEQGKEVEFVYPGMIPEKTQNLIDKDKISANISQRELIVTIDYSGTPATQAQYFSENDTLKIKMGPVPADFGEDRVSTKLTGFGFDLVIVVGAQEKKDLGFVARHLDERFADAKLINIDHTSMNTNFGDENIVDTDANSISFVVHKNSNSWGLNATEKSAKALLTGMSHRTL